MHRTASFTPEARDYVVANRAWLLRALDTRRMRWSGAIVTICLLLFAVMAFFDGDWSPTLYTLGLAAIFGAIQLINWALTPRRVRQMVGQRPAILSPTQFVWDEDGAEASSDAGVTRIVWRELFRWWNYGEGIVFQLSNYMLFVLPDRALDTGQRADLEATLVAHGPPRR